MKIIFLGTPHFAKNILECLINSSHQVVAVVCQPNRSVGRKQILEAPETKVLAEKYGIPVYQFNKIRLEGVEPLKALNADIMVTAAYGQILSREVLDITPNGVINVHGSVLPAYRGSSPVQWSLINGEKTLGVTILKTDVGIDNGPVIFSEGFDIEEKDTVETLLDRISAIGCPLLLKALEDIERGEVSYFPQEENRASYYPMLKKENAVIDFNKPAEEIKNFIRGMANWPVAQTTLFGVTMKVYSAKAMQDINFPNDDMVYENHSKNAQRKNGEVIFASSKKGVFVRTGEGILQLLEVQMENGRRMDVKNLVNGNKIKQGDMLGQ